MPSREIKNLIKGVGLIVANIMLGFVVWTVYTSPLMVRNKFLAVMVFLAMFVNAYVLSGLTKKVWNKAEVE